MSILFDIVERGLVPDWALRLGIQNLVRQRLRKEEIRSGGDRSRAQERFSKSLAAGPIAIVPEKANEQHYEVPPKFFELVLGEHLKYSSCYFPDGVTDLSCAEREMLQLTARRAELKDGMDILELGCGWGSLTLWMAKQFPRASITAISNSRPQKQFIEEQARRRSLSNVNVITSDINEVSGPGTFDRVVSVEMFEHMRNYQLLLSRIASWLKDDGKLFVHIFCHKTYAYEFVDEGASDWMAQNFFSGGIMPSEDLLTMFDDDLLLTQQWRVSGKHYEKTALAWLANMEDKKDRVLELFREHYQAEDPERWFVRWKLFFLACAGLFGHDAGQEWFVSHYLFSKRWMPRGALVQ